VPRPILVDSVKRCVIVFLAVQVKAVVVAPVLKLVEVDRFASIYKVDEMCRFWVGRMNSAMAPRERGTGQLSLARMGERGGRSER
jgi:hypothetical protein